ncbi:hypothetical protein PR001_g13116 [Phytophthora rubi]|uniref:Uncharacterized protein n=1 Tax=Phytophthora rubi TaxID=129364 RepID=A0A6A3LWR3_9STRA|nr:hypothetical protein PR001_g13116 [Phytophthora rubi]
MESAPGGIDCRRSEPLRYLALGRHRSHSSICAAGEEPRLQRSRADHCSTATTTSSGGGSSSSSIAGVDASPATSSSSGAGSSSSISIAGVDAR